MIYKQQETEVQTIGEFKNNSVKIQEKDMDFILTILSSNLYSDPISSLIREYTSNALDSHKEAGVEEPIIVSLKKDINNENQYFFSVQDFGVGISKERFYDVFLNLASSTKRESNDFIGMWGLGRLSGLSYTNQVTFTSIHNGIKTIYIMYKDGNKINIDETISIKTEERNGVTIKINVKKNDLDDFIEKIPQQLQFFKNIYLDLDIDSYYNNLDYYPILRFNSFKIKDCKYYKLSTLKPFRRSMYYEDISTYISLGDVTYPIDKNQINATSININKYPFYLKFDIGELEVTPNRESILYSKSNIKKIEKRYHQAVKEFNDDYEHIWGKNYINIFEYKRDEISYGNKLIPIFSDEHTSVQAKWFEKKEFKLMGVNISELPYSDEILRIVSSLFYEKLFNKTIYEYKGVRMNKMTFDVGRREHEKILTDLFNNVDDNSKTIYCLYSKLNNVEKAYLQEKYKGKTITIIGNHRNKKWFTFIREVIKTVKSFYDYNNTNIKLITKTCLNSIKEIYNRIEKFSKDDVPNDFKLKNAEHKKKIEKSQEESVTMYHIRLGLRDSNLITSEIKSIELSYLTNLDKEITYIWINKEKMFDMLSLFKFIKMEDSKYKVSSKIHFFTVSDRVEKKLIELNKDNVTNYYDFMSEKTELIKIIGTIEYIERKFPFIEKLSNVTNVGLWNKDFYKIIELYKNIRNRYSFFYYETKRDEIISLKNEIFELCSKTNSWYDKYKKVFDDNEELINNSRVLINFSEDSKYINITTIQDKAINLVTDYILAKNLFPVDEDMIKRLKEETVLNKKKEDNE